MTDANEDVCVFCVPSAMPDVFRDGTPRQCRSHAGTRFGDIDRVRVWLDGVDVSEISCEAIEGDPGCVLVRLAGGLHEGDIELHFPTVVRYGDVRVDWLDT